MTHFPDGIITDRVILRRTLAGDLPDLISLWNDGRVMRWVGFPDGLGHDIESAAGWLENVDADPDRNHFVVKTYQDQFCGEAYYAMDRVHRRAALDIKLAVSAQGRGLGTEALSALIRAIFLIEPDADVVWTEPSDHNLPAMKLYERCGLRPAARPPDLPEGPSYWELQKERWLAEYPEGLP